MSLPWLKDDYKRPGSRGSRSRSRSRSSSRSRRSKFESSKRSPSRSRSRSRSPGRDRSRRGGYYNKERGSFRRGGRSAGRGSGRGRRRRNSNSSSSGSGSSHSRSPTRLVASNKPKYVDARVFVANILSKDVTKDQLTTHFEKYGNVVDVLIHPKNYAFIQYLKVDHAKLAVEGESGSIFNGCRIDVKMANLNRKGPTGKPASGDAGPGKPDRDRLSDAGPYGPPDPYMHPRMPYPPPLPGEFGPRDPFYPDPYRRPFPPDPWIDDPFRREPRDPYADPYRDQYAKAPQTPTECVVFYVNRQLQTYAESIERRVKDQSIFAISTIIPEGRTAPQMIDDLSGRGGLFAIFINTQNETHRSLTLNILHGTPQEHRNMPLNDAITLIGRSFEKYVEDLRTKANKKPEMPTASAEVAESVALPPSSEVNYLLNLLADKHPLTVQELNTVIKYLQERRDKLLESEKGPLLVSNEHNPAPPERPVDDTGFGPRKSPDCPPARSWPEASPMDRGHPDRQYPDQGPAERGPPEAAYHERLPYDREPTHQDGMYDNRAKEKQPPADKSKPIHEELTKKILSIFQGAGEGSHLSSAPPVTAPAPTPAPAPPPAPVPAPASSGANLINFDNPNVQKALDNLIQSGPNLLKSINPKSSSASTSLATSSAPRSAHANSFRQPHGSQGGYGQDGYGQDDYGQDHALAHGQSEPPGHRRPPGHLPPGMMDPQSMYQDMQGQMAPMPMQQMPMMGAGPPTSMPPMSMGDPVQQMAHFMMAGMAMNHLDAFGGQGFQGAPRPPLPRVAPPPPPPPQQQY